MVLTKPIVKITAKPTRTPALPERSIMINIIIGDNPKLP